MTFTDWLTAKREETSQRPLVARLTSRIADQKAVLDQLRLLHKANEFGVQCVGCRRPWPCATFMVLDGSSDCPSRDPWSGAACAMPTGHGGRHGGMDNTGSWRSWL